MLTRAPAQRADVVEAWSIDVQIPVTGMVLTLDQSAPFGYVIDDLVAVVSQGSLDVEISINGTPVTGMSGTVDSTEDTFTATAANVVSPGDRVVLTFSSLSVGPIPIEFGATMRATRT